MADASIVGQKMAVHSKKSDSPDAWTVGNETVILADFKAFA
jgi:hypothetical protein